MKKFMKWIPLLVLLLVLVAVTLGLLGISPAFVGGFGTLIGALIGLWIANTVTERKKRRDPNRFKQQEILEKDERHVHIREKAGNVAGAVTVISLLVAVIFFTALHHDLVSLVILIVLVIYFAAFFAAQAYFNRKM
ncbi:MAG: DUF2178 domain-containing protein [Oscillospiraceae bacterium]|nr:DUF2178 domain-containing protein [Oscillospiraceae bacterium]